MALLTKDFLARLASLEIVSRRIRHGRFRGERRSVRRGASVEFADHRPYGTGDDLRFLDWSLYARLEVLMTKLFHDEEDLAVHLVLDRSASMDFGEPTKALHAKKILAALGYVALLSMHRVTVWTPGESGDLEARDLRSARSAERLFNVLEAAEVGGATAIDLPLKRWMGTRRPRGVLLVASDFLHKDGAWEHLKPLVRGGLEVTCLRVLSPDETRPVIEGDLRLLDAEDGSGLDITVTPKLLERYETARAEYDRRLDQFCRARGIELVTMTTDESFERFVLDVLRAKGLVT